MRAVVMGAAGQLGEELARRLPEAMAFDRSQIDVTRPAELRETLVALKPDVVFNATSYNRVDAAELQPDSAFAVNAHAVREMATICRDLGARLVHFSTNYAFGQDASRRTPYRECDRAAPINAYGVSKVMGEDFVLAIASGSLVIRTAALFGRSSGSRHNFLDNMLAKARSGERIRIVDDQTVAPTTTADLASAAIALVGAKASGLFHVNGAEPATWFELAREYLTLAGVGDHVRPATTAEIGAPARRPGYSVMDVSKYLAMGLTPLTPWRDGVREYWSTRPAAVPIARPDCPSPRSPAAPR